jgi:hypothetical protein
VEHQSNETAALALLVEGKVVIHKIDAAAETGEMGSKFLQCLEALDAARARLLIKTPSAMIASQRSNWTRWKAS